MDTPSPAAPTLKRAPNIQDVADALGMHKSTVSLGLSGKGNVSQKTRERIEAMAREMGYEPNPLAQRLAKAAVNNLIGLCAGNLDVGVLTEKILLIQKALTERGLEAPIYTLSAGGEDGAGSRAQMRNLCRQQPRAIICSAQSMNQSAFEELERYQLEGGIVVSYDVPIPVACDQVIFDREDNAYQTARHLIQRGHRDLGLALSVPRTSGGELNTVQNARFIGFNRALEEAGLKVNRDWIFEEDTYEIGGARLAADFLALKNRPTGICIVNDYMALAFMSEVLRAGVRIPKDISVIGHDNQPVAAYCPVPLSSATHPAAEIAEKVVELLAARLEGSTAPPQTVTMRCEIIERESVTTL
jgi:DNA-binding LacI/PurR family transcriptional regulator